MCDYNLWDDFVKLNEMFVKLVDSVKVVDVFKDFVYKVIFSLYFFN